MTLGVRPAGVTRLGWDDRRVTRTSPRNRTPRIRAALLVPLVGALLAFPGIPGRGEPTRRDAAARHPKPPIVVIVMENHEYDTIMHSSSAGYLRSFARRGTLFTRFYARYHPSLPNYLEMTSGHTSGCTSDSCPTKHYRTDNLFHQLSRARIAWVAWEESMGTSCRVTSSGSYVARHNPPVYYADLFPKICPAHDRPYPTRPPATLGPFTFVTPNLCHDMHECSIATGDQWLREHVPPLLRRGAVVVITFDEGSSGEGGGGHVFTAVAGHGVRRGTRNHKRFTHAGLLAGLERWFGVPRLYHARRARPLPV